MSDHWTEAGVARCTLPTEAAIEARLAEWAALRNHAATVETTDDSVAIELPLARRAEVEDLVAKESACCDFLRFSVERAADHVVVTIRSEVPGAQRVLHALGGRPTSA